MKKLPYHEKIEFSHNTFSVKVALYEAKATLTPQWHDYVELLYFLDGEGTVTCNEKTFTVKKGDLIFVNSSQIHTYTPKSRISFCCILLYPWFFSDVNYDEKILIENFIFNDDFVSECMDEIIKEHKNNSLYSDMIIKSCAYKLMAYLVRNYTAREITSKDAIFHRTKLRYAETLLFYISNHYAEKITSTELSSLCYMTKSYFCRFFKKTFGKTPLSYINEYRIEKACVMLLSTSESITEIALSNGFEDINYFSRTFKKLKGVSPTEFRSKQL